MDTITLKDYLDTLANDKNAIRQAIGEWALDYANSEVSSIADIVKFLETTDCAACHAPAGLIYNHDIAQKLAAWHAEIGDALEAYEEAVGDPWTPDTKKGQSFLTYVWFAVEWNASEITCEIESLLEEGKLAENTKPEAPSQSKFKREEPAAQSPRKPSGGGMKM